MFERTKQWIAEWQWWNNLSNSEKGGIVLGITGGLIWGLIWGLSGGLVGALVGALVLALVGALVLALVWGLAEGLGWGLGCGLGGALTGGLTGGLITAVEYFPGWMPFITVAVIIGEILFFWDRTKLPKGESKLIFTAKIKFACILLAAYIEAQVIGAYYNTQKLAEWFGTNYDTILYWIGRLGVWVIALLGISIVVLGWLWINSLKYEREKYVERPRRGRPKGSKNKRRM